jgi:hypothetical protein
MMTAEETRFLEELTRAVDARDVPATGEAVRRFSSFCFGDATAATEGAPISDDLVEGLSDLVFRDDVLVQRGSFRIVGELHSDWARFSAPQRERLAGALVQHYPRFASAASRLLIVEILSQWLGHPRGILTLRRLFEQPLSAPARETLAHGLNRLIRATDAPDEARSEARRMLDALAEDTHPDVRAEARRLRSLL